MNLKDLAGINQTIRIAVVVFASFTTSGAVSSDVLPEPVTPENFEDLRRSSPFIRSVEFSDSLVLTGMARIEGNAYATLFDSESKESYLVSEKSSSGGWQLVSVKGNDEDPESLSAKIQTSGGEIFSIRYQKLDFKSHRGGSQGNRPGSSKSTLSREQMDDARRAARNPAEGFRGDGFRGTPPPEIMEKLNRISPQQREEIARRVMQMRNDGVNSDTRRKFYQDALNRAASGRR